MNLMDPVRDHVIRDHVMEREVTFNKPGRVGRVGEEKSVPCREQLG